MAELTVIPKRMPVRFEHVDTDIWAAQALCMLQNADWKVRPHYLVGVEEPDMWQHMLAFNHVMKAQGVPMVLPKRNTIRQRMSRDGLVAEPNVAILGGYHPNSFFELMEGAFPIPMGDTIDAISDAYDEGHPIYIIQLTFRG